MIQPYYQDESVTIYNCDCREILSSLPKVDLVLSDPPYGMTENSWDKQALILDKSFWLAMASNTWVFTGCQPFSSRLVASNIENFRHEWIWQKNRGSNFANTVREPMKEHEHVLVFSTGKWTYNPQAEKRAAAGLDRVRYSIESYTDSSNYREMREERVIRPDERVPSSVQKFNTETGLHPTQKPLTLFAYLVKTYSNNGDTILDPFMGSGTTLRAAKDLGRKAIGIEVEERYCEIAAKRMSQSVFDFTQPSSAVSGDSAATQEGFFAG